MVMMVRTDTAAALTLAPLPPPSSPFLLAMAAVLELAAGAVVVVVVVVVEVLVVVVVVVVVGAISISRQLASEVTVAGVLPLPGGTTQSRLHVKLPCEYRLTSGVKLRTKFRTLPVTELQ